MWLLEKFTCTCDSREILLGSSAPELGKAVSRPLPGGSQEKQSLEFPLNSTQPQPLKNVCSQTAPGFQHSLGVASLRLLPNSPCVRQPPRMLRPSQGTCASRTSVTNKAGSPLLQTPASQLARTSKPCGNFPGVTFSLPADPRDVASLPQDLSQLQGIPSPLEGVPRVRGRAVWCSRARLRSQRDRSDSRHKWPCLSQLAFAQATQPNPRVYTALLWAVQPWTLTLRCTETNMLQVERGRDLRRGTQPTTA